MTPQLDSKVKKITHQLSVRQLNEAGQRTPSDEYRDRAVPAIHIAYVPGEPYTQRFIHIQTFNRRELTSAHFMYSTGKGTILDEQSLRLERDSDLPTHKFLYNAWLHQFDGSEIAMYHQSPAGGGHLTIDHDKRSVRAHGRSIFRCFDPQYVGVLLGEFVKQEPTLDGYSLEITPDRDNAY